MNLPLRSFDWKSIIPNGLAIAGLVLTAWIWQNDFTARSLSATVSTVRLQVPFRESVPDVQVTIGGTVVKSPYISVITLTNDGQRPISTSDFESPIVMTASDGAGIIRTTLTATRPSHLKVELATSSRHVKLSPMLLNPGDALTMAVITSGERPTFKTTARIAGISSITVEDEFAALVTIYDRISSVLFAAILCAGYGVFALALIRPAAIALNRWTAGMACLAFGLSSAHATKYLFAVYGITQGWYWQSGAGLVVALPVFFYLSYRYNSRTRTVVP